MSRPAAIRTSRACMSRSVRRGRDRGAGPRCAPPPIERFTRLLSHRRPASRTADAEGELLLSAGDELLESRSGLERGHFRRSYLDRLARTRVARGAGRASASRECSEAGNRHLVALLHRLLNLIDRGVDHSSNGAPSLSRAGSNGVNELFLVQFSPSRSPRYLTDRLPYRSYPQETWILRQIREVCKNQGAPAIGAATDSTATGNWPTPI